MSRLRVRVGGVPEAMAALRELPKGVRRKGLRIALSAAGGEYKRVVQASVPRETGLLKKAIGVKVAVPNNLKQAWVKVGAKRGMKQPVERNKRGKLKVVSKKLQQLLPPSADAKYRNPTRYLHLVEGGTSRGVRPNRFMRKATVIAQGRAKEQIAQKLRATVLSYRKR